MNRKLGNCNINYVPVAETPLSPERHYISLSKGDKSVIVLNIQKNHIDLRKYEITYLPSYLKINSK